ncbi:hypothetical protein BaRGS_00000800, partial [Batillaria attramentaria]
WATYLIGFCVCAAIGILFFIVMPFVGLIFCCCRCAGKCGGRHKPHDPKRAGCKRKTYCTVLLVLNTVTLAGVVCAFLSNELVYQKLTNQDNIGPVGKLTSAIGHLEGYINDTVDEVQTTLLRQFDNSRASIEDDIRNTANNAVDEVLKTLNATALLDQTKKLSQDVNRTQDNLKNVAAQLSFLSSEGRALTDNLTEIADGAAAAIKQVTGNSTYGNFKRDQYVVTADFSGLDQLSTETEQIEQSLDMNKYIAENAVADTKNLTTSSVNTKIDEASSSIDSVRAEIDKGADSVRDSLKPVIDGMQSTSAKLEGAQPDISKYSKYGWYGGLAVSCLLLLVVVVYYLGVLFGLCGERPGLGAQCCNTGTGANFLMAGVGFTFIFAWLIMLVCVILFVVGGPAYTEVCRYFDDHSPQELKPFETALLKASDLTKDIYNGKDVDLSITGILDDCFHDKPIYGVMKLDNMVNLTAITDLEPLEVKLDELKNAGLNIPDIQIVSAQLNQTVENFANSGLVTLNFTPYYTEVNKKLTVGDLTQMSDNLKSIALHTSLNQSLTYLDGQRLGLKSKVNALLEGLQQSENNFNDQKNGLVTGQLETVVNRVIAQAQGIVNDILNTVRNDLGKCRPIYDGFYAATDAGCVVVLDPLNGFWFSVGWCLFFFIPSLIFAVKLAGLYRREHDEKDFDDPLAFIPLAMLSPPHRYMIHHKRAKIVLSLTFQIQRQNILCPHGDVPRKHYKRMHRRLYKIKGL